MSTVKASVTLVRGATRPRFGNHEKLFAYSYCSIALMLGIETKSVRQAVTRGAFDPTDLESVLSYVAKRRGWLRTRSPKT